MRILTLSPFIGQGGSYSRYFKIINALSSRNTHIDIITYENSSLFNNSVNVISIPNIFPGSIFSKYAMFYLTSILIIVYLGIRNRYDLTFSFGPLNSFPLLFCMRKRKLITFIRGYSLYELEIKHRRLIIIILGTIIYELGLHFSNKIIVNSVSLHQDIHKKYSTDSVIIPNNIPEIGETQKRMRKDDSIITLSYIGKFTVQKNVINLIKAFKIVVAHNSNFRMNLIGSGPIQNKIIIEIETNSLQQLVEIIPWQDEIIPWIQKSDLIILPSFKEGSPNIIFESVAVNVLPIGSNIPDIAEIIIDDNLRFSPFSIEEIAQTILFAGSLPEGRKINVIDDIRNRYTFDWLSTVMSALLGDEEIDKHGD